MAEIINNIGLDKVIFILFILVFILFFSVIFLAIKYFGLNSKYRKFMEKIGKGENIEEDLENYMYRVERVEKQNYEINNIMRTINEDMNKCIQKVGIVRYSAFNDIGSDLSFALALLDYNNDGIVLNGIYSREMSNIYAKPIKNGKSSYTISQEEQEAINKAIACENVYNVR